MAKNHTNNTKEVNIMQNESWNDVGGNYNSSTLKDIDILFNKHVIEKINEYKNKAKKYKENI